MKRISNYYKELSEYGYNISVKAMVFTFVLILMDYLDVYNLILKYNIISFCIILIIIFKIISLKIIKLFSLKTINYIDAYSNMILLGLVLYTIVLSEFEESYNPLLINIIIIFTLLIIIRIYFVENKYYKKRENTISLNDLYNDNIPDDLDYLFINDDVASADLLDRDFIVSEITNSIKNCNYNSTFVMAIKGEWGSGKSSILNFVKKELKGEDGKNNSNIIFIDEFNPWLYSDVNSMLMGFFDIFSKNVFDGFQINEVAIFTKTLVNYVNFYTGHDSSKLVGNIDVNKLKNIINDFVERNNKKIVIIIDNLERCNKDNILFILDAINNILNFNNTIYVLSYDEKQMKKIFETDINVDYTYLEKIIQLEYSVPVISEDVKKGVLHTCIKNYITYSKGDIDEESIANVTLMIDKCIGNLREFKRLLNSVFTYNLTISKYLNNIDMILIEVIHFKNPELWNEIRLNGRYFIGDNNKLVFEKLSSKDDIKIYMEKLFKNSNLEAEKYVDILMYLFPNVNNFVRENSQIKCIATTIYLPFDNDNDIKSALNRRIYDEIFFDLYFNKSGNIYIAIDNFITDFIDVINSSNDYNEILTEYIKLLDIGLTTYDICTSKCLRIHIGNINKNKLLMLAKIIYSTSYKLRLNNVIHLKEDPRETIDEPNERLIFVANILCLLSKEELNIFINEFKNNYRNLGILKDIVYYIETYQFEFSNQYTSTYDSLNDFLERMKTNIIKNKINMYDAKNYERFNILTLLEDKKYQKFIKDILCSENIMLFILDYMYITIDNGGVGYNFKYDSIDEYYGWNNALNDIESLRPSQLKRFLLSTMKNASNEHSLSKDELCYYTSTSDICDINFMVDDYLGR